LTNPVLAVTQPDGSRKYVHPATGESVSSITTIIKAGIPQPWLGPWAAKMAALHADANWERLSGVSVYQRVSEMKNAHKEYAQEKADIGDVVHDLVDCWSTGRPYPGPPKEVRAYVEKFIDFLTAKRPRFIENEVTLWSRAHGYAGTADFIIEVDGKILLADLKTGKNLHEEIGLQLSALAHCDFILRPDGTEEPIPEIDGIAGLHLRPRSWKLKKVSESGACFQAFLSAKEIMRWQQEIAPKVLA
jgi:hypothetical protein